MIKNENNKKVNEMKVKSINLHLQKYGTHITKVEFTTSKEINIQMKN